MTTADLIAFLSAYASSALFPEPMPPRADDAKWFIEAADALRRLEKLEAKEKP